ncbi:MAG: pilus assembly protein PilM [Acidobacteria bacterium]|nr:pilus assembly protein PilM [Acidobacteriota bacterium]
MSIFSTLRNAPAPAAAVEIASGRVSAACLEWRGQEAVVAAHATEPLPDGALTPALTTANTHDRAALVGAIGRVLDRVGGPRRVGLAIPDVVAKVSLVRFEQVPARAQDLDQLVRWQVRKTAPFAIEDAQVSYVPGLRVPEGQEFIVSIARRAVIEEYEGLCAEAGAYAGLVDLATFNVINAVLAGAPPPPADWLLVHVATDYTSIALMRGTDLIFFRNRAADADGTLADLVHQTAMYYEDRLKGAGFARVIVAGASGAGARQTGDIDQVRRSLEERLATPVDTVDPRAAAAIADRITASPTLLDTLAPLVGLLLRDHERQGAMV